ncbi:MAG: DUF1501 domain-containing protein, partial [Verrucomicrobia bacterium]|nr:DUF1501 domain-containing protein [Verrucomicrobiota bacterium]
MRPGNFPTSSAIPFPSCQNGPPPSPHVPAKARRVIFLFMEGAVSQVDSFDHKPLLEKYHGQEAHRVMG